MVEVVPSIKGTAFQSVVDDVRRLVDEDRVEPSELASHLTAKDRGFLDVEVTPIGWFPIATYGRMLEVLAREEGGADPQAYLCARGAKAAERMLSGIYEGFVASPSAAWGMRVGQMMLGIGKLLYNFTAWKFRAVDREILEVEVSEARDYPEPARYTAQGFLCELARRASGRAMRVTSSRPTPDRIVYRIRPA